MIYGGSTYGSAPYGSIDGGVSPNANVNMTSLGNGGRLTLLFTLLSPNVNGVDVNLANIANSLLILYFNKNFDTDGWFADAGELWKRVPLHSGVNFKP
jgi:hypothetical protein